MNKKDILEILENICDSNNLEFKPIVLSFNKYDTDNIEYFSPYSIAKRKILEKFPNADITDTKDLLGRRILPIWSITEKISDIYIRRW